jgi:hypothetical protein
MLMAEQNWNGLVPPSSDPLAITDVLPTADQVVAMAAVEHVSVLAAKSCQRHRAGWQCRARPARR